MKIRRTIHCPAILALTSLALLLVSACSGPSKSHRHDPALNQDEPTPAEGAPSAATAGGTAGQAEGTIARPKLDRTLKRGAQRFVTKVDTRPAFRGGRFFGWRLVGYRGPGPIKVGDVIVRINGLPIERPEQVMKVWEGLKGAKRLKVRLIRNDSPMTFTWSIVD